MKCYKYQLIFQYFVLSLSDGQFWVSIGNTFVITFNDLRVNKLDFAQRNGFSKYIKIGNWAVSVRKSIKLNLSNKCN